MKRDNLLLVAALAFSAGYIASKVMQPGAPAPVAPAPQAPRGIGVAQYGNCQCANGTMCVGKGNCECCTKAGGVRIHTVITAKAAMPVAKRISGNYGGLA